MFSKDDEEVIDFITELEDKIKQLIYEKKDKCFILKWTWILLIITCRIF